VRPTEADDDFVLASDERDRVYIDKATLLPGILRVIDGGEKWDTLFLPYNKADFQRSDLGDGGIHLTTTAGGLSSPVPGADIYRFEAIVYNDGEIEKLGKATTQTAAAKSTTLKLDPTFDYAVADATIKVVTGSAQPDLLFITGDAMIVNLGAGSDV